MASTATIADGTGEGAPGLSGPDERRPSPGRAPKRAALLPAGPPACPLAVTVLGCGGPVTSPHRASAGYLVWVDGVPAILIDAGGGTFERLGRGQADPSRLEAILLTRIHAEHSGGLAPIILAAYLQGRRTPMTLAGPAGTPGSTGTWRFIDLLFGEQGAWRDLRAFEGFGLDVIERQSTGDVEMSSTLEIGGVTVHTAPVPRGPVPSLAYRIDHTGHSLVVSGEIDRESAQLVELATGCDVLVCDMALRERPAGRGHPHAAPTAIGRMAQASMAGLLVLSHLMPAVEEEINDSVAHVESRYDGPVMVAEDLMTIRIGVEPGEPAPEIGGARGVPL